MSDLPYPLFCLAVASYVAVRGARKKSLTSAGAGTAFVIGFSNLMAGPQFGCTLLTFFLTSSKLTNLKHEVKAKLEADYKHGGQRTPAQVLANSMGGTVFAITAACKAAGVHALRSIPMPALTGAFLGHYACCCADTWASEVGVLSSELPRLITTLRPVPKGTNGGVSMLGTLCGLAGSLLMGLTFWGFGLLSTEYDLTIESLWTCMSLAVFGGVTGNLLDSFLGAVAQFSGYSTSKQCIVASAGPGVVHISGKAILSNTQVNFISALTTAGLTAGLAVVLC